MQGSSEALAPNLKYQGQVDCRHSLGLKCSKEYIILILGAASNKFCSKTPLMIWLSKFERATRFLNCQQLRTIPTRPKETELQSSTLSESAQVVPFEKENLQELELFRGHYA